MEFRDLVEGAKCLRPEEGAGVAQDVDGLVGLGLASMGDHSPAEKADLSTMPRQAKRAAILMTRLSAEKGRK